MKKEWGTSLKNFSLSIFWMIFLRTDSFSDKTKEKADNDYFVAIIIRRMSNLETFIEH